MARYPIAFVLENQIPFAAKLLAQRVGVVLDYDMAAWASVALAARFIDSAQTFACPVWSSAKLSLRTAVFVDEVGSDRQLTNHKHYLKY